MVPIPVSLALLWYWLAKVDVFNTFRDSILSAFFNSGTSFYGGFLIFSVLGFMAKTQGVEVRDVVQSGKKSIYLHFLNYTLLFLRYYIYKRKLQNEVQRREDACITILKRSYSSSHLLRNLVPRVALTRPYALRTGETVSVPFSSRTNRFGNFCTIKYQNHV